MEPFDTIEKLITEHGSAAILREHVALLKSQMQAKDATIENQRIENENLKRLLMENQSQKNNFTNQAPAEVCPYCRRDTLELKSVQPMPGLEVHGIKTGHYKCSNPNCGKTWQKQIKA